METAQGPNGKPFESLGRYDVADEATLPFNPRNSIDYPKVSTLARETSPAGLTAAEDALRTSHPLPWPKSRRRAITRPPPSLALAA